MSKIYKFHHVIGDNIKKTYVFNDINSSDNKIQDIPIYEDDMIINIKHKIASLFEKQSHSEIYMFCKSKETLNQSMLYNILTQDDNIKLNSDIYKRFISNIAVNKNFLKTPNDIPTKQLSSFYKNKKIWNKENSIIRPIGINAFHKKKYIFHHNPFSCNKQDDYIADDMKKFISTENKKLLFKYKPENDEIYFCFADEVLEFLKKQKDFTAPDSYILQLYFPSLFNQKISSLEDIKRSKVKTKSISTKEYNSIFKNYNKNIDLLHKYSSVQSNVLKYYVKSIYFTIHPMESLQLPLEVIFKKINSSRLIPLIKYNPGKELESIYRLYTNEYISNKGLKIPSLYVENGENSRKIKQVSSNILYTNRIGIYFDLKNLEKSPINEEMYCIIMDNGDIQIKLNCVSKYDIHQIQKIFYPVIKNQIVDIVKTFVHKKHIYNFKSIHDNNVELNNIDVIYSSSYIDNLTFKNLKCTSSVFSVINKSKKNNIYDLNYKRVSFYQKMNDVQSFINAKLQEAISIEEIKQLVMSNFNFNEEKTVEIMDGFLKEIRLASDAFENRKIKIEDSPGFDIHIETKNTDYENVKLERLFEIKNINDITYLSNDIIKKYLVALININQLDDPLIECTKVVKEKQIESIKEIYENPLEDAKIGFDSEGDDDDMFDLMSDIEESSKSMDKSKSKSSSKDKSIDLDDIIIEDDNEGSLDLDSIPDELSLSQSLSLSGGVKNDNIDLTSIKLKGSKNWFTNRLRKRQPDIFVMSKEDEKNKNYVKYSKSCPWQYKKQPIILNDDELKKIDKSDKSSNSKSYDGHIKYNGYNYICPRYWCFKDDNGNSRSISFKQINDGECGGWDALNPKDSKSLLKGKRIVELTDDRMHNPSKSNNPLIYKPLYPFLQKSENHPKGFCAPCCSQVPLEYDGFPEESQKSRDENNKGHKLYFQHIYNPGNKKGEIIIDKTFKDDKQINSFIKQWEGLGPSFKITKRGNNVKIIDIGKTDSDPSRLNKIDLIPKNKNTPENPTRNDIDKLLSKSKNNKRFYSCTTKPTKDNETNKIIKKSNDIKSKTMRKKKSKTLTNMKELKKNVDDDLTITKDPTPLTKIKGNASIEKLNEQPIKKRTTRKKVKPFLFEFPLKLPGSFGYLKPSLQKFIQYDTTSICYNNPNDSSLKQDVKCLLRLGVPNNPKQSFIENIAAIQGKSLSQFKNSLISKITITKYVVAFKGNLIDLFYDKTKTIDSKTKLTLVKSINDTIINDFLLIDTVGDKLINSYLNFINYLKDDNTKIDYTYLWDFICKPMDKNNAGVLFEKGINIVIFNAPQDDTTDKIEIICPKNYFTNEIFSEFKPTILLYKEGFHFEPIVLYDNKTNTMETTFDYDQLTSKTMIHNLFTDIKNKITEGCALKPSIPDKYDYKKNISAKTLIENIVSINSNSMKTRVLKQVIHYNYKTIGIIANINNKKVYIPCQPSPIIIDIDYEYFDSPNILFDAIDTFNTLTLLAKNHNIPCLPLKILLTDKINITGFITETNQVVPTKQYDYDEKLFIIKDKNNKVISKNKSIINIQENNEYFSDKEIMKQTIEDVERVVTMRNFLLEKNFYNCYRNIFKKHIGQENNGNLRQQLIDLLDTAIKVKKADTLKEYNNKFKQVSKIVGKVINDKIVKFVVYNSKILNDLYKKVKNDISVCISNENIMTMPLKNLINKTNNKEKYNIKLIDELIRYPRIRDYILQNKSTTTLDVINYSINNDEVIVLEEEMFNQYLNNVVLEEKNKYINTNQNGFTKPVISKSYKKSFNIKYNKYTENDNKKMTIQNFVSRNVVKPANDVDKYVLNRVDDTPSSCSPVFNKNKNIISKIFNNYSLNKHLKYHKIIAPKIEGMNNYKTNCSWSVIQEIYRDYYNTNITKMDLCKTLLSILKKMHNDKTFVTKPGQVTTIPNYYNILLMTHRRQSTVDWSVVEENDFSQWSHLFNIISNIDYYITEFEVYLLCKYFKLPCIIHGTTEKKNPVSIYKKSKIEYYDPLYTTYNTQHLGKKVDDSEIKSIKNNLYINENNESFCYIIGYMQFRVSDYYTKDGVKNNRGLNKYYLKEYKIPFDVGLMKTIDDSYKIQINSEYTQKLIQHSNTPAIKTYIDMIFKPSNGMNSIYETFKNEMTLFKKTKQLQNNKVKIKQNK
jgi:hypothetical protein